MVAKMEKLSAEMKVGKKVDLSADSMVGQTVVKLVHHSVDPMAVPTAEMKAVKKAEM